MKDLIHKIKLSRIGLPILYELFSQINDVKIISGLGQYYYIDNMLLFVITNNQIKTNYTIINSLHFNRTNELKTEHIIKAVQDKTKINNLMYYGSFMNGDSDLIQYIEKLKADERFTK